MLYGGGERKDHLLESVGTGAAFIDFDEDGRLDVFLVNAWALDEEPSRVRLKGPQRLVSQPGRRHASRTSPSGLVSPINRGAAASARAITTTTATSISTSPNFGPNRLYRNRGDGTFEQVAEKAGVA